MPLSQHIINQFAKLVEPPKEQSKEIIVKGEYRKIDDIEYVNLDGSDILTPVTSVVEAETGERVIVSIKDHSAIVTGNISSPAARSKDVKDIKDTVDEFGNTIQQIDNSIIQQGNSIIQMDNKINQQNDTINSFNNVINQQNNIITNIGNTVNQQNNDITQLNNSIIEQSNRITSINNTVDSQNNTIKQQGDLIISQGNTITAQGNQISSQGTQLESFNSDMQILNSAFKIEDGVMTGLSEIIVNDLTTNNLNAKYADIDFANIGMLAVEKLFAESGIIKDLVVDNQKITGELVGVTIKGDLIEGNTIKADKLVVRGEDGLYYKLNMDSLGASVVEADEKYQNGMDGSIIIAKSITAEKVSVSDLVAFNATIGGFHITDHSIYSGTKASIDNNNRGIYLNDDGELYFGDANNRIKYYKTEIERTRRYLVS